MTATAMAMVDIEVTGRSIVWLGEIEAHEVSRVGAKAAHLSRLATAHVVPDGFVLTADASLSADSDGRLSTTQRAELAAAYAELARRTGITEPPVAVRSSAVDEDGPTASFAGQHETLLNITGVDALLNAVEQCWASARSPQALAYRRLHGLPTERIALAVLVQLLVRADVSGVAFSTNPVRQERAEAVVTASWGLGESIVGGTVTPDTWHVCRNTLVLIDTLPGVKRRMTIAVPGGTREVDVPRLLSEQLSLSEEQARAAARLALDLETAMGWPVDIEFAISGERLFLLQCRPITTLGLTGQVAPREIESLAAD
jgi:phosphoenolpyruvate synthase/pyruvate phosphate dikinase